MNEQDNPLNECQKSCIANVGGRCAVSDCVGEIRVLQAPYDHVQLAAKHYDIWRAIVQRCNKMSDGDHD